MIRRYYILPLRPGMPEAKVDEFMDVLGAADRFIPGLRESSAGYDPDARTVVWENAFVDEESYSGPYMVHPFHIGAIDDFVMADSPDCLTQDIYVMRYQTPDPTQRLRHGIRRVLLLNIDDEADAATLAAIAARGEGMATSGFGGDDIGWVSAKGRAWTHVWEQAFTDTAQLERYLASRDGIACSSLEGFTRLGLKVRSLKVFTVPFSLTPIEQQTPPATPADDGPLFYSITARLAADDLDEYVALLERLYDPFMEGTGASLAHRRRTELVGYLDAEVQSTWQLDSFAHYCDIRAKTYADPAWNDFVRDAMPLVRGGSRRFHRPV